MSKQFEIFRVYIEKDKSEMEKEIKLELKPGVYYWCTCSKSNKLPHCDGSHKGTDCSPEKEIVLDKETRIFSDKAVGKD